MNCFIKQRKTKQTKEQIIVLFHIILNNFQNVALIQRFTTHNPSHPSRKGNIARPLYKQEEFAF